MELISGTGLSPAPARLSRRVPLCALLPCRRPYYPARASTPAVWACPLSLAATRGVTVVFLSSDYWDVSVRRVRLPNKGMPRLRAAGCPIRTPADQRPFAPPRRLSRPAASFCVRLAHRCARLARVSFSCVCFLSHPVKEPRHPRVPLVENVGLEPTTPGLQSRCSSQLSQSPNCLCVVPGRLELPTPTLSVWCSNRLSYGTPSQGVPGTRPLSLARLTVLVCSGQHRNPFRLHLISASPPERRCSSRTFRYGYLVTT